MALHDINLFPSNVYKQNFFEEKAMVWLLVIPLLVQEAEFVDKKGERFKGKIEKLTIETRSFTKVTLASDIEQILLTPFRPLSEDEKTKTHDLVEKLGNNDPQTRENAMKDLQNMGPHVLPILETYRNHKDPEVSARLELIVDALKHVKGRMLDTVRGKGMLLNGYITSLQVSGKQLDLKQLSAINFKISNTKVKGQLFSLDDDSKLIGKLLNKRLQIHLHGSTKMEEVQTCNITKITRMPKYLLIEADKKEYIGEITTDIEIESLSGKLIVNPSKLLSYTSSGTLYSHPLEGEWRGTFSVCTGTLSAGNNLGNVIANFKVDGENVIGELKCTSSEGRIENFKFKGTVRDNNLDGKAVSCVGWTSKIEFKISSKLINNKIDGNFNMNFEYTNSIHVGTFINLAIKKVD